ncbi:hypothetical protein ERN12_12495 [Rhodobacteraceae bacterium]|nr:hypothetical protein ERN12_12495 [Paracoccaceae bacterium]
MLLTRPAINPAALSRQLTVIDGWVTIGAGAGGDGKPVLQLLSLLIQLDHAALDLRRRNTGDHRAHQLAMIASGPRHRAVKRRSPALRLSAQTMPSSG